MYDSLIQRMLDANDGATRDRLSIEEQAALGVLLRRGTLDNLPRIDNEVNVKVFHSRMGKLGMWEDCGTAHNARTDAGAAWTAGLLGGALAASPAKYIALTTDATAVVKTDTTLASEQTLAGLARALGTYTLTTGTPASLNGQDTFTIAYTFTYTGSTSVVIAKGGLFTAASAGTMSFETVFPSTATVNANGDQIAVTWTVNC